MTDPQAERILHVLWPDDHPHPDPDHVCSPEYACWPISRAAKIRMRLYAPWSLITDRGWWRRNVTRRLNRRRDRRQGTDLHTLIRPHTTGGLSDDELGLHDDD